MLFTSAIFIGFLLCMFCLYYLVPKKLQWVLLLLGSYVFYGFAGLHFLAYILTTTITTWFGAIQIQKLLDRQHAYIKEHKEEMSREDKKLYKASMKRKTKAFMLAALLLNLGILAVIKYTDFFIMNINGAFGLNLEFFHFALPMGISFYIFQSMGYLIDVYRDKQPAQQNLLKFGLFVSFFPQLIQGPISRYDHLGPELFKTHTFDWTQITYGLQRILWGFFKKLVIADRMLSIVKVWIGSPEEFQGVYVLLTMFLYAIELYADFTGGIDITIGIAQVFGIRLAENFDRPFFSKNTAEYWRRWHITMGTWFRDYIFYPMSVSQPMLKFGKKSKALLGDHVGKRLPVYMTTAVTWFATGIWHGASWNFIVWGMLNCLVLIVSQELEPAYAWFHSKTSIGNTKIYGLFQIARTFVLMSSIRVLDCYRDVPLTFKQIGTIFTTGNWNVLVDGSMLKFSLTIADYIILLAGVILMILVSIRHGKGSVREAIARKPYGIRFAVFAVLFITILIFGAYGVGYDSSQFIYNQF